MRRFQVRHQTIVWVCLVRFGINRVEIVMMLVQSTDFIRLCLSPGGGVDYGERGGTCPGRLRQHVCTQQLQTWPPRSTPRPV